MVIEEVDGRGQISIILPHGEKQGDGAFKDHVQQRAADQLALGRGRSPIFASAYRTRGFMSYNMGSEPKAGQICVKYGNT